MVSRILNIKYFPFISLNAEAGNNSSYTWRSLVLRSFVWLKISNLFLVFEFKEMVANIIEYVYPQQNWNIHLACFQYTLTKIIGWLHRCLELVVEHELTYLLHRVGRNFWSSISSHQEWHASHHQQNSNSLNVDATVKEGIPFIGVEAVVSDHKVLVLGSSCPADPQFFSPLHCRVPSHLYCPRFTKSVRFEMTLAESEAPRVVADVKNKSDVSFIAHLLANIGLSSSGCFRSIEIALFLSLFGSLDSAA